MTNAKKILLQSPLSRLGGILALSTTLTLGACQHDQVGPATRNLPPPPARLAKAPPLPRLTASCAFPWFGVSGCKGEDAYSMLRLTNSSLIETRSRLNAVPDWYESVRRNYKTGR